MKSAAASQCAECYDSVDERRRRHNSNLKYWYGLSLDEFEALLAAQHHRCALCGSTFGTDNKRGPAVDHDHVTGAIRGIIHQDCNRGLGHFNDNPFLLDMAAHYLRTARTPYNAAAGKYAVGLYKQRQWRKTRKSDQL